jgi:uncharacterized membrane protein YjjB (DUF3815 family)
MSPHSVSGLLFTSSIGYVMSTYTLPGSGSLIIAAFCVTIASRLYSYYIRRRYFLYIYAGLLVLVPGSVSVRGFIGIWSGDNASAIQFTLLMLTNCICLAMGVFLGMIPRKRWILWRRQKLTECCHSLYGYFLFLCCCRCCSYCSFSDSESCAQCSCRKSSNFLSKVLFFRPHSHVSLDEHPHPDDGAPHDAPSRHRHHSIDSKHSSHGSIELHEIGMTSSLSLDTLQQQEQLQEEAVTTSFLHHSHSPRQSIRMSEEQPNEESIVDVEDGRERRNSLSLPQKDL